MVDRTQYASSRICNLHGYNGFVNGQCFADLNLYRVDVCSFVKTTKG